MTAAESSPDQHQRETTMPSKSAGVKGLMIAVSYGATSVGMSFANKAILSHYDYDYPLFIISCQMVFTIIVLEGLGHLEVIELDKFTLAAGKEFFLPSLCYAINSVMSLAALSDMNIPIYGAIKRCTPILILILSKVILKKGWPSTRIMLSVLMITGGCLLASKLTEPYQ